MVVVQIFTLVLTTALLRHSERTISAAPSPRFGGPRPAAGRKAGAPLALPVEQSANSRDSTVHGTSIRPHRVTALGRENKCPDFVPWKTGHGLCVILGLLSNRQFTQQGLPAQ